MNRFTKIVVGIAGVLLGATVLGVLPGTVSATNDPHVLTVDGSPYQSTKVAGGSIHWETPDTNPTSASFPERNQVWTGNGSDKLPCPGGIHWISNANVLTVSHCLEVPTDTTVPDDTTPDTTVPDTTVPVTTTPDTTVPDTTTPDTTVPSTDGTAPGTTDPTTTTLVITVPATVPTTRSTDPEVCILFQPPFNPGQEPGTGLTSQTLQPCGTPGTTTPAVAEVGTALPVTGGSLLMPILGTILILCGGTFMLIGYRRPHHS